MRLNIIILIVVSILAFNNIEAQTAKTAVCQPFNISLTSSTPSYTLSNGVYKIIACPSDTIVLNAQGSYPNNNTNYTQNDSLVQFHWSGVFGSIPTTSNTLIFNNVIPQFTSYNVYAVDTNACTSDSTLKIEVIVSPYPDVSTTILGSHCAGDTSLVIMNASAGSVSQASVFVHQDTSYLPDGSGVSYISSLLVSGVPQQIFQGGIFLDVMADMEHSYIGDLQIEIICPNGQSSMLKSYPGGGSTFFGEPIDNNSTPLAGVGYEYHWNMQGSTTMLNAVGNYIYTYTNVLGNVVSNSYLPPSLSYPANSTANITLPLITYSPENSFYSLFGCPINGIWKIKVTDNLAIDNGFIFKWGLDLGLGVSQSYNQQIVSQAWNTTNSVVNIIGDSLLISPNTGGEYQYTYTITDSNNCVFDTNISVEYFSLPIINLGNDTVLCGDQSIALSVSSDFVYQFWSTNSSMPSILVDSTGIGYNSTLIYVQVKDTNSCINTDTIMITFESCNVGLEESKDEVKLILYPNPNNGVFTIEGNYFTEDAVRIKIYNVAGNIVINRNIESNNGVISQQIDLSTMAKGIYLLRIESAGIEKEIKLIIK